MATDIKNLIAAINPELYCDNTLDETGRPLNKIVKALAEKEGYLQAAKISKLRESDFIDVFHLVLTKGAFAGEGLKNPIESHSLVYDAFSQNLEPIYFWILDYINKEYGESEKLIDNFLSSPGSGHFAEMQSRATRMQDEAMKIFGNVNTVIKSIINIIYDLKEYKIRLAQYSDLKSNSKEKKNAALLSLKQIWLDSVDIKRGNTAIKAMAQNYDYVTIIDAFMAADSLENLKKLDLNDRVRRILQQRYSEFERWISESERELKKRFEIEKIYLKTQVDTVKLYARWVKPYLKAARALEQTASPNAALVTAFNTSLFELVLLAKGKYDLKEDVAKGELPEVFKKMKLRKYHPIAIVEFSFRTAPDRVQQQGGYGYRGRVEIKFTSFSLNDDELNILRERVAEDDFGEVFKLIEGATDESLQHLKDDLDELLNGKESPSEKKKTEDTNPFSALFSFLKKEEKKDEGNSPAKKIRKDNGYENVLRNQTVLLARVQCRKLYDSYKKTHGMQAFRPVIY